ncbi:hypothetical protein CLU79DRAFT_831505 [Phycomyces nitens]|nr:hypothetical protein CLU79DRAFT_831505 [Phycomyces nitens]
MLKTNSSSTQSTHQSTSSASSTHSRHLPSLSSSSSSSCSSSITSIPQPFSMTVNQTLPAHSPYLYYSPKHAPSHKTISPTNPNCDQKATPPSVHHLHSKSASQDTSASRRVSFNEKVFFIPQNPPPSSRHSPEHSPPKQSFAGSRNAQPRKHRVRPNEVSANAVHPRQKAATSQLFWDESQLAVELADDNLMDSIARKRAGQTAYHRLLDPIARLRTHCSQSLESPMTVMPQPLSITQPTKKPNSRFTRLLKKFSL